MISTNQSMSILRRFSFSILRSVLTLLLITSALYATVMLTPPETLASLYMPKRTSPRMTEEMYEQLLQDMVEKYHLDDPFPVQYYYWAGNLLKGNWGYSPNLQEDVFPGLVRRAPATLELTFYAILIYFPLGLLSGVLAGTRKKGVIDRLFRSIAFVATSLTPMILAIMMMVIFYITLRWFAPGRLGTAFAPLITAEGIFLDWWGSIVGLVNNIQSCRWTPSATLLCLPLRLRLLNGRSSGASQGQLLSKKTKRNTSLPEEPGVYENGPWLSAMPWGTPQHQY